MSRKTSRFGWLNSLESFGVNDNTDTLDKNPDSTFTQADTQTVPGLKGQAQPHVASSGATLSFESGEQGDPNVEQSLTGGEGGDPATGVEPGAAGNPDPATGEGAGTQEPLGTGAPATDADEPGAGEPGSAAPAVVVPAGVTEAELIEEATVTDDVDNLDTDVAEVNEYVEEAIESLETGIDALARLEQVNDIASSSMDEGGLDRTGAAMLTHAVESFMASVPGSHAVSARGIVSSVESFGGTGSRHFSTEASIAGVKEMMGKWAANAKKAVEEIIQRIIQMVQFLLSRFGQIEKRLDKQMTALNGIKTDNAITVKNKSVAQRLNWNGKVSTTFSRSLSAVLQAQQTINASMQGRPAAIESLIKDLSKNPEEWNSGRQKLLETIAVTARLPNGNVTKKDGKTIYTSGDLPGGKVLVQTMADESKGLMDNLRSYSVRMEDKEGLTVNESVTTMTVNEAKAAIKVAKEIVAENGKLNEAVKAAKSAYMVLMKAVPKEMGPNLQGNYFQRFSQALRALSTITVRMMSEPATTFSKYALTLVRDTTLYVDMTIKANKAGKESKNALDVAKMPRALANNASSSSTAVATA